jgi:DNA-binding Lrp family transcriptional regulator
VQARLDKLSERGVISSFGPVVEPARMGYPVLAFVFLEIAQGRLEEAVAWLRDIPEVLEAHTITGAGDLMIRAVARSNADLRRVIGRIVGSPGIVRTSTVIALATTIHHRTVPLVQAVVAEDDEAPEGERVMEENADG